MQDVNTLNGYKIYYCFISGVINVQKHREHLNEINVFPIADGDTGNNLSMTMGKILHDLKPNRSAIAVLHSIARLSLSSARGNSGLIISQYINGLVSNLHDTSHISFQQFAQAAEKSVALAYEAIDEPMEGTILTVLKVWANSLFDSSIKNIPLPEALDIALSEARISLNKTKEQLPVLKKNNVVDSGALGLLYFLEGMAILEQNKIPDFSFRKNFLQNEPQNEFKQSAKQNVAFHDLTAELTYRYCTEILIAHSDSPEISDNLALQNSSQDLLQNSLKAELKKIGDCVIVSKGMQKSRIHIHTNEPFQVVDILKKSGHIQEQKVDDMFRQQQIFKGDIANVAVLTDSLADIPQQILDKYHVHQLSLKLTWGHDEYLDRLTITAQQFYQQQTVRTSIPGSTPSSSTDIQSMFQYLTENYKGGVIVLPVARALSGMWNKMNQIAKEYNQKNTRITVIDTCLNSVAQGLLVIEVAKAAAKGYSLEELTKFAEELKKKIKIFVCVRTLKYMIRSGRLSPAKGFIASLLNLKPIVSMDSDGKGILFSKAFSSKNLLNKIAQIVKKIHRTKGIRQYALVHGAALEETKSFAKKLETITQSSAAYITELSPIVGMYSGEGVIAVGVIES